MLKIGKSEIKAVLPHREPFLFLDEVEISEDYMTAIGYFTSDESYDFFKGHFPGNPVLPGVIMVEAAAQTGACAILIRPEYSGKTAYFAAIEEFKFKRVVRPNETLKIEVELTAIRGRFGKGKTRGYVGDELAFEGSLSFYIGD
jgi:3-hydroxyacyl-[acyl-carrier-protein] dehydratase